MLEFWKITPGGNPTILLRAEDVPAFRRAAVAAEIMNPLHIGGEQVGFVRLAEQPKSKEGVLPRLDMMGGEFCLNATRAFAVLLAHKGLLVPCLKESLPHGHARSEADACFSLQGMVEVSGAETPVNVRVDIGEDVLQNMQEDARRDDRQEVQELTDRGDVCSGTGPGEHGQSTMSRNELSFDKCFASACLRFTTLPRPERLEDNVVLLRVPGIAHLVLENTPLPESTRLPEVCADLRRRHHLEGEEAVGCLWLDTHAETPRMEPAVWVRDTQTLCLESACGSGTLACALLLAHNTGGSRFSILQPSGEALNVSLTADSAGINVWVDGPARLAAEGRLSQRAF